MYCMHIYVCICITELLHCIPEIKHNIVNQLHFNKIIIKKKSY